MSLDLGINPAILRHAHKIKNPSFEQLCTYHGEVANHFMSLVFPRSHCILVTQISAPLFRKLENDPDLIRVLHKLVVSLQHTTYIGTFLAWLAMKMNMRLSVYSQDYWFRGAVRIRG